MNRFQYVGTINGVLRSYPGTSWAKFNESNSVKRGGLGDKVHNWLDDQPNQSNFASFDPRLTPWFASAISGIKTVVILMDTTKQAG